LIKAVMKIHRRLITKISWNRDQSGMSLLEALVAIAMLGGIIVVMVFAMSGGILAVGENAEEVSAQELARSQMEYIKSCVYDPDATTYPTVDMPNDYSISVVVEDVPDTNTDIQKVTAKISRGGDLVMTVTDYKVNR
jgi:type II secretory pathway pseudopilin PulG